MKIRCTYRRAQQRDQKSNEEAIFFHRIEDKNGGCTSLKDAVLLYEKSNYASVSEQYTEGYGLTEERQPIKYWAKCNTVKIIAKVKCSLGVFETILSDHAVNVTE